MQVRGALTVLLLIAACGGSDDDNDDYVIVDGGPPDAMTEAFFAPGDPMNLTGDNPAEDEDPTVLRAADGTMVVAWFGRQNGNGDLFVTTTRDGTSWTQPVRITDSDDDDFAPHLIQTSDGWYHITWFRRAQAPTYFAHVLHTSTRDLASWNRQDEVEVADADPIEDWVPTIAERPDGDLEIVFVSHIRAGDGPHDLYATTSNDGGRTWNEVTPLAALNDPDQHDHLPYLARTGESELTLTWNRCDISSATPWTNSTSDVLVATSGDGDDWSAPRPVTDDDEAGVVDVFPALFADLAGAWSLVWVTTAIESSGSVIDLPVAGAYPAERAALPQMTGYSPRIAATPTEGVFLGIWVQGEIGAQDIHARFFTLP